MRDGTRTTGDPSDLGWNDGLYENAPAGPNDAPARGPSADHGAVPTQRGPAEPGGSRRALREQQRTGAQGGRRKQTRKGSKSGKPRILRWVSLTLAVLILGTAAAGWAYYQHLNSNLQKDDLNLSDKKLDKASANGAGQTPLNILLLGSDSRNSAENVKLGGGKAEVGRKPLADVQMLLHVSADRSNMSVVSIPRDTRVTIPKCTDPDDGQVYAETDSETINASLQHGGPGCTVATWEELTGIPIDHFMMIDFAGVVDMADAVGGVPVCVKNNVEDSKSGLKLKAGTTTVLGEQALQWLRTRHAFEDGSDIGRTHAQHMYMNSMVRQLKAGTKLTDPVKLNSLAEAATNALTVDDGLGSVTKLYSLADDLKSVPTKGITMTTMPWGADPQNPTAHVVPTSDATVLFTMIRNDTSLNGEDEKKAAAGASASASASPSASDTAAAKGEIPVMVQNGTGTATEAAVSSRAAAVTGVLRSKGFSQATTDSTPKAQADTTISYPSNDLKADAQSVATALGLPKSGVKKSSTVSQITLVIGADWRNGSSYPVSDTAETDEVPDTASALNASEEDACMTVNVAGGYSW